MKIYLAVVGIAIMLGVGLYIAIPKNGLLGGVSNYLDTSASGFTTATSSVGVFTPVQLFASVTKHVTVQNYGAGTLYCALDSTNKTAASSTVAVGFGLIINASTTDLSIPAYASFGECYPGEINCFPHKGAVDCVSTATGTVIKQTR